MNKNEELITKALGDTEGPLGFRMPSALAVIAEEALKAVPQEVRSQFITEINGQSVEGYCRLAMRAESLDHSEMGNERTDKATVMTESVDRDREVVKADGCIWKEFERNPMVTFNHARNEMPVGRAVWVKRNKSSTPRLDGWVAKTRYHTKPQGWEGPFLADAVWELVKQNSLPGRSIGFIPLKARPVSEQDLKVRPDMAAAQFVIEKCLILEYAVGVVPVNPDALQITVQKMRAAGIDGIDLMLEHSGMIIPRLPTLDNHEPEETIEKMLVAPLETKVVTVEDDNTRIMKAMADVDVAGIIQDERDRMCGQIK